MNDDTFSKVANKIEELHGKSLAALQALQEKQQKYVRGVLARIDPKKALAIRQKMKPSPRQAAGYLGGSHPRGVGSADS